VSVATKFAVSGTSPRTTTSTWAKESGVTVPTSFTANRFKPSARRISARYPLNGWDAAPRMRIGAPESGAGAGAGVGGTTTLDSSA
jgi:hypothetical protein